MKIKYLITILFCFAVYYAHSQNTTNLPPGTDSRSPVAFRTLGTDTLNQTWVSFPGLNYRRVYSSAELNKMFRTPGSLVNAFGKHYADSLYARTVKLYMRKDSTSVALSTISQLENYAGPESVAVVTDSLRGGIFIKSPAGIIDSGRVFGGITGKWVRIGVGDISDAAWWGVSTNSSAYLNAARLSRAVASANVLRLEVGHSIKDTIRYDQSFLIENQKGKTININCVLKRANVVEYPLTADSEVGATTYYVANANTKFRVNDVAGVDDNNMPNQGGQTTHRFNAFKIVAVYNDRVIVDSAARSASTVAGNSRIFKCPSGIVILNSSKISLQGTGVIDGNRAFSHEGQAGTNYTESFISDAG
ncbi:MAG: hypothetical protein AAGC65_25080, partial [Mucilaginibacter sp.]|uniref:hypothetical protein n=1 Tax=Mucilaginibacter sp. TaxID=1882438 RepID=UPI0031A9A0D7